MTATLNRYGVWIGAAIVMLVLPYIFTGGFALSLLSQMGIAIIFALAYNMLLGQGGMLSFGHAVYFGLAGYASVHFLNSMLEGSFDFFPVILLPIFGGLVGLFFGVLIGFVSTRRAGTTFAMISLRFAEMATALTLVLVAFFNGEEGVQTDRMVGPEIGGITLGPDIEVYYLISVWCLICAVAMYLLTRTPFGRMSNAVRDNPERAEFVGYNTQRVRWLAFALSSFFAGAAGSLHALNFEHVGFETVGLVQSGSVLFMAYIGGVGHFAGPVVGAILITTLNGVLSDFSEAWFLYLGLLFVIIVMFAPGGLAGLILMHEPVWKTAPRLLGRLVVPYILGIASVLVTAVGVLSLIEMLYHVSNRYAVSTEMGVFGLQVDTSSAIPWIGYAAVVAVGAFMCRMTFPRVAGTWGEVIAEARRRMFG
jgi:branched-chain amino acid transport system permease protein